MKKYMLRRILFSIFSLLVVIVAVMLLELPLQIGVFFSFCVLCHLGAKLQ